MRLAFGRAGAVILSRVINLVRFDKTRSRTAVAQRFCKLRRQNGSLFSIDQESLLEHLALSRSIAQSARNTLVGVIKRTIARTESQKKPGVTAGLRFNAGWSVQ